MPHFVFCKVVSLGQESQSGDLRVTEIRPGDSSATTLLNPALGRVRLIANAYTCATLRSLVTAFLNATLPSVPVTRFLTT